MTAIAPTEAEETLISDRTLHLSYSRIAKYLLCPEQYRLYYLANLRPRLTSASLVFGQTLHQALAHLFKDQGNPVLFFQEAWADMQQAPLTYNTRESWEKLRTVGEALLRKFLAEEVPKLSTIQAVERPFRLDISSLDLPFVGIIDLIVDVHGRRTVVDFKTSASSYEPYEVALSDQLTAYQLAEPEAEQLALCVLVKTKEPRIEWHWAKRTPAQLTEYLAKADLVAHEIHAGHFFKRPGKWCAWCDYLPVCLGDQKQVKETLVQIT